MKRQTLKKLQNQIKILRVLDRQAGEPATLKLIADQVSMSVSGVHGNLHDIEKEGFVKRAWQGRAWKSKKGWVITIKGIDAIPEMEKEIE